MGDPQSQLSTVTSIQTTYGGYWTWQPKMNQWADGNWVWVDASSISPASIDYPKNGFPFTGNAAPFLDPTHTPDGTDIGRNNNNYDGQYWPGGTDDSHLNSNYIPPDAFLPGLGLAPGAAPHITGDPPGPPGNGDAGLPPSFPKYRVAPGSLRDAELGIDDAGAAVAAQYTFLANLLTASKGITVFYAPMGGYQDPVLNGLQPNEPSTDPNPHLDEQLKMVGDNLAKNTADVTRLAGQFGAALNTAGQIYAKADLDSFISDG
jgi:hypothetical protein